MTGDHDLHSCRRYADPALSSARFQFPVSQAGGSLGVCLLQSGGRVRRVGTRTLPQPVTLAQASDACATREPRVKDACEVRA